MKITPRVYNTIDFPPFTNEQKQELDALNAMPDTEIDYSDVPEFTGKGGFYYAQPVLQTIIHK